ARAQVGGCGRDLRQLRRGQLEVAADGIDAGDGEAEALRQSHRLPALTTADVEHDRVDGKGQAGDDVVEHVRAAGLQTLVELGEEPLLDARVGVVRLLHRGRLRNWRPPPGTP